MRVFLSSLQALRPHPIAAYQHWELYLKRGIEEAGCEWVEAPDVDWVEALTLNRREDYEQWRERTWSRTLEFVRSELKERRLDLFLGYLYPEMVEPGAIREIQKLGLACVNFFCDNVREFRRVPNTYHCFDLHWVPEYQALSMYRAAGLKYIHAPMPCWISPEQRAYDHSETQGITFIGSSDRLRRHLLGRAFELGADIRIFGAGWGEELKPHLLQPTRESVAQLALNQWKHIQRHGVGSWLLKFEECFHPLPQPPIPRGKLMGKAASTDLMSLMQQSSITLGINRVQTFRHSIYNPVTYSRLRDIEAPMVGACYLTEWAEDLEHMYMLGHDIETYRTPEELVTKIRELLAAPEKRRKIRQAGQRRALGELTIPCSLAKIMATLGLRSLPN